jgi:protein-tyrosine kinase
MNRHIILGTDAVESHDEGRALMSDEGQDGSRPAQIRARGGFVPVFRPGQPAQPRPVTLDQKTGREILPPSLSLALLNPARIWESITEFTPKPADLAGNGLFADGAQAAAAGLFDILRTRVLQAMAKNGWTRLAVTSPTPGCGKSLVAANLALALARLPSCRTVLLDLDLRAPALARMFGAKEIGALADYLLGEQPMESQFRRIGRNLALGLNGAPQPRAAELIQDPEFPRALEALRDQLQPDLIVLDTPAVLGSDEVISLAGQVDAVLLVVDGTRSSPQEIAAAERLLEGQLPLLGVVLNRAQDRAAAQRPGRNGR